MLRKEIEEYEQADIGARDLDNTFFLIKAVRNVLAEDQARVCHDMRLKLLWERDLELSQKAYDTQHNKELREKLRCEETKCALPDDTPVPSLTEAPDPAVESPRAYAACLFLRANTEQELGRKSPPYNLCMLSETRPRKPRMELGLEKASRRKVSNTFWPGR